MESASMKQIQRFFYVLTLLFLTACGSGDSIGGGENPGDGNTPTDPILSVSVSIDKTNIDADNPAEISVTVTKDGSPLSGEVVSFSSNLGVFTIESSTALTDGDGIARIGLMAGTVEGAGTVTASIGSGESGTVSFYTAGDAQEVGPEPDTFIVELSLSTTDVSRLTPATVTATVTSAGEVVAGEVVTFESSLGNLTPEIGTALTNDEGIAIVMLSAGDKEGAGTISASLSNGSTDSLGFYTAGDEVTEGTPITVEIALVSSDPEQETSVINATTPGKLVATVTGIDSPVIVTFASDIGEIPIPTAITDENNQAMVDIYAGTLLGAGTATASLQGGESAQQLLVVGATDLMMGSFNNANEFEDGVAALSLATVSAGGTTVVSVEIVDEKGDLYTLPVDVDFSSNCTVSGTATLSSPITSSNGKASSTYLAKGCIDEDPITVSANAGGINLTANATVTVLAASAGSIEFVSATPENISLQGIGGQESATVVFRVLDTNGDPVSNAMVNFALNTTAGGIELEPASATSDIDGLVQTVINSGTVATPVRVTASLDSVTPVISSQSSLLVISTGIPDQDSFSLSAETVNPEAWDIDGQKVAVTARLADAFNNPVPDGTAVSFTTEGGSIESSCLTSGGACSVIWTSQQPRPDYDGRASILAFAIGEESFPDLNGNGRFDSDEHDEFLANKDVSGDDYDLPEAFVDHNEDGMYDVTAVNAENEEFYDFVDPNGLGDGVQFSYDDEDGLYNGVLCNRDVNGDLVAGCSEQTSMHVRGQLVIVMSGSGANFTTMSTVDFPYDAGTEFDDTLEIEGESVGFASVYIADLHDQPMPKGSVIEFEATAGSVVGPNSFTWNNDNRNSGTTFSVSIEGEGEPTTGNLIVTVTTPSGAISTYNAISINITAPAPVVP